MILPMNYMRMAFTGPNARLFVTLMIAADSMRVWCSFPMMRICLKRFQGWTPPISTLLSSGLAIRDFQPANPCN